MNKGKISKFILNTITPAHGLVLIKMKIVYYLLIPVLFLCFASCRTSLDPWQVSSAGEPARLEIREAGTGSIRVSLIPQGTEPEKIHNPVLAAGKKPDPVISLTEIDRKVRQQVGNLFVEINTGPLTVNVTNAEGEPVQEITFLEDGRMEFSLDDSPVLGLGEGGPGQESGWRELPVEFDRRGRFYNMQPRWQAGAYGSRNPVTMMIGTGGWGIFVTSPWGQVDLRNTEKGFFIPVKYADPDTMLQDRGNQQQNLGKGIPPMERMVEGLYDVLVFDAHNPIRFMKDVSTISGPSVMPPRWALGYMQSHRTLEDESQMIEIVDIFREKQIPVDAVIYLGTGFCPRGWNKEQPSFEFNPEVFSRDPGEVISDLHGRNVKVVVHMVPWDRDRLPTLHGNIPPRPGETLDASHISTYWKQHVPLVKSGVDAWWPDEGDWFNLYERINRHRLYYQGPLSTQPNVRPWSLHRNGHLGIARWGGWVWSGDTESSWKTLEVQVAVGINHSLSLSPFWGSDIGGFFPTEELTGELYARWFQFGAFCPSFRSHGRTWWTRLPWGWGLSGMGPIESEGCNPSATELNNPAIEQVCRKYAELRYRLLTYNYTLAWEARSTGMPMMRAMWLHYPEDSEIRGIGDQYLWGGDMLIAPVYEKEAVSRSVYLPKGEWYDWWTLEKIKGKQEISREVDLSVMPIYVRAGAIIPLDPVRQYTSQEVDDPLTVRIYSGNDGSCTIYEDDGTSLGYLDGEYALTQVSWDENSRRVTIEPIGHGDFSGWKGEKVYMIELIPDGITRRAVCRQETTEVQF